MDARNIESILQEFPHARREDLIPVLQAVQAEQGYLSEDAMQLIGRHLKLPASKVYGVATFYNQFRFHKPGRFHIQVCRGTACHVKGSVKVLEAVMRELKIESNQTTRDGVFSLEVVACIGACGLAPALCINGEFHARVTPDSVKNILNSYRSEAAAHA